MNLEIGCGDHDPGKGWETVDIRPLPHVTYVQSAVDLSNIETGRYDLVAAKDVIEHISWWDVPATLSEWLRVVKPGGVLDLETPNAYELAEQITNPGSPRLPRWEQEPRIYESDWQRFCRTAFGHQDYPANYHASYFTPQWLTDLLYQAGASTVRTVKETLQRFRLEATK